MAARWWWWWRQASARRGLRVASAGSSACRRTSGAGLPGSIALGECTAPDAETRDGAGRWEGERRKVTRVHPRSLRDRGVGKRHTGPGMPPCSKVGAGMEGASGAWVARPGDTTSKFGGVLTTHRAPNREIRQPKGMIARGKVRAWRGATCDGKSPLGVHGALAPGGGNSIPTRAASVANGAPPPIVTSHQKMSTAGEGPCDHRLATGRGGPPCGGPGTAGRAGSVAGWVVGDIRSSLGHPGGRVLHLPSEHGKSAQVFRRGSSPQRFIPNELVHQGVAITVTARYGDTNLGEGCVGRYPPEITTRAVGERGSQENRPSISVHLPV